MASAAHVTFVDLLTGNNKEMGVTKVRYRFQENFFTKSLRCLNGDCVVMYPHL